MRFYYQNSRQSFGLQLNLSRISLISMQSCISTLSLRHFKLMIQCCHHLFSSLPVAAFSHISVRTSYTENAILCIFYGLYTMDGYVWLDEVFDDLFVFCFWNVYLIFFYWGVVYLKTWNVFWLYMCSTVVGLNCEYLYTNSVLWNYA